MNFKPFLVVISAPSGGGKTSITTTVLKRNPTLKYSVSATTRPIRKGEVDEIDYFFLSPEEFENLIQRNAFIEWAIVHNHYYGTPLTFTQEQLNKGHCILLDIDVQGARQARNRYADIVSIFILPPSLEVLEQRLRKRGTESESTLQNRLKEAQNEIKAVNEYDYIVINRDLETSVRMVESIILAEQCRRSRTIHIPCLDEVNLLTNQNETQ